MVQGDTTTQDQTLSEAGMAAELAGTRWSNAPTTSEGERERDRGGEAYKDFHSEAVVQQVESYKVRSYITEEEAQGLTQLVRQSSGRGVGICNGCA